MRRIVVDELSRRPEPLTAIPLSDFSSTAICQTPIKHILVNKNKEKLPNHQQIEFIKCFWAQGRELITNNNVSTLKPGFSSNFDKQLPLELLSSYFLFRCPVFDFNRRLMPIKLSNTYLVISCLDFSFENGLIFSQETHQETSLNDVSMI